MKLTAKKVSILGLVLMAASAVTAAVLPSRSDNDEAAQAGSLTTSTAGGAAAKLTCVVTAGAIDQSCNVTAGSRTTGVGLGSSDANLSNSTAGASDIDG